MSRILLFGFLVFSAELFAQQASVRGTVLDASDRSPVNAALVYLHESGKSTYTDEDGAFVLSGLRTGTYHLHVQQHGYNAWTGTVKADTGNAELTILLKLSPIELNQVVLGGEQLKTDEEKMTQPVEVADKEFLEKNYGNTFAESLEEIPGISALNTGSGISKPVIRGMSFNRIIVNDQGVRQEGQQWGIEHGLEIDQFSIENVEIIKGAGSFLYGSDGIGGVINILPPSLPEPKSLSGEVLTIYRSNNNLFGLSSMIEGRNVGSWVRARYSRQDFGDYRVPADSFSYLGFTLPLIDGYLKNTAGNINSFHLAAGNVADWGKVSLTGSLYRQKAGFFPGAIGIPRGNDLQPDESKRDIQLPFQQIDHYKLIFNSETGLGQHWLETDAGYQVNIREEHSPAHIHIPNAPAPENDLAHRWDLHNLFLNSRYHISKGDSLKFINGLSFQAQKNKRQGFEFLIPAFATLNPAVYSFIQYDLRKSLTVNLGLRADVSHLRTTEHFQPVYADDATISGYELRAPAVSRTWFNWSGGTGLSWYPNEKLNIKLNVGRSFRVPTPAELTVNGVHHGSFRHEKGDPDLDPESGYQFDLTIKRESGKTLIRFTPFYNYFTNYIFLRPTLEFSPLPDAGQIYQYSQAKALHSGYELFSEYHPFSQLHLSFSSEYVFTRNLETGLPMPFIPPLSLKGEAELSYEGKKKLTEEGFFAVELNYFAGQYHTARNEKATGGYFLVNLVSAHEITFLKQRLEFSFRVNNLFNERYLKHLSRYRILNLPEQGRNFMISLKVPLESKRQN